MAKLEWRTVVQVITTADFERPMTPRTCSVHRYHVWRWRPRTDDRDEQPLESMACQCGALRWTARKLAPPPQIRLTAEEKAELDELAALRERAERAEATVATLQDAIANQRGDDLCWITNQAQAKALPEKEFLESCRRYRQQIADERGEFTGGKTIAQLEADRQAFRLEAQAWKARATEEIHEKEKLEATVATLHQEKLENDCVRLILDESDVPTVDPMGTLTLSGRLQAYIDNVANQLATAEASLARLTDAYEQGWQPIETAPNEGWFLAASDTGVHIVLALDGRVLDLGMSPERIALFEPQYAFKQWHRIPPHPEGEAGRERTE